MIQAIFPVIADQWQIVFGILLLLALGQALIILALKIIFAKQLTSTEYLSLGMAGWILPAALVSLLWFLFGFEPASSFNLFILISLLVISIFFLLRIKIDPKPDSKSTGFFLLLFFFISVLLRLAFVSKAILPSYFDSAQHYLLIKNIIGNRTSLIASLSTNYYHLGYHLFTAFTASTFQAEITRVMLILGQMVLTVIPLAAFFLIKHATRSNLAGIFTVIVAAYGWYMPAHAVDWGKYPALLSLGLLPFALGVAYLLSQHKNTLSRQKRRALYLLLGLTILISGFMHSRSLVILGIVFAAWAIAAWQQKLPAQQRAILFFAVSIAIVSGVIYIQSQAVLLLLFDPYIPKGLLITAFILLLSIFAQRHYPQFTLACILATGFCMGSLFIPVKGLIPGYANLTLLDRPYVEMILFLPLSLLGGLGLAGLEKNLQNTKFRIFIGLSACSLVWVNAFFTYDLYPSDCCVIVGNDDMAAMDWMNTRLPADVRIGISATELKVLTSETFEGYVGGDAGIWITPLIGRGTFPIFYALNFGEQATLDNLCQMDISHLYVGQTGYTFDNSQLNAKPAWYQILLSMPEVKVYQVIGCK